MKRLYVMVGIPGAGKDTFINKHLDKVPVSINVVSKDKIRFSLIENDAEYFSKEKEVYKQYIAEIKNSLITYDYTVANATHINHASRNKLIRNLAGSLDNVEVIAIVLNIDKAIAIANNENRRGTIGYVPQHVIERMSNDFTIPELTEGFDRVELVR